MSWGFDFCEILYFVSFLPIRKTKLAIIKYFTPDNTFRWIFETDCPRSDKSHPRYHLTFEMVEFLEYAFGRKRITDFSSNNLYPSTTKQPDSSVRRWSSDNTIDSSTRIAILEVKMTNTVNIIDVD